MALQPDFRDLLEAFARHQVRYLVIGGYAVSFHARPRATKDLDLLLAGDGENLARVARALTDFGAPPHVVDAVAVMGDSEIVYFGVPPLRVDLLQQIPGAEFEAAWASRVDDTWGGIPVSLMGREALISAKRAAGRPQDIADVAALEQDQ